MRITLRPFFLLAVAALSAVQPLPAQSRGDAARVRSLLALLQADNEWTLQQQRELCEIPAPPFKETERAAEFRRRLEALGLRARTDAVGNVLAEREGTGRGGQGARGNPGGGASRAPVIVLAGHLDTVFPESTDVKVRVEGGRMSAPGIADNCRGLAVVLAVARAYQRLNPPHAARIIFVGNVGEEGPGNLRGVRHLFERELRGQVTYFVAVDGAGLDIASRAVGSVRYKVTFSGPGGHSYGAFGIPNPIHALGRAIAKISDIEVPATPKTTFNVGVIDGGTSVNSIAFRASMEVDMRSENADALRQLDSTVRVALADAAREENGRWTERRAARARVTVQIDTIGIRPTGAQSDSARIVQTAVRAGRTLGFTPQTEASSTDANIPISLGVPGISIDGGGSAAGAHSLGEWYEDGPRGYLGPQWAALIVAMLAGIAN